MTRYCPKCGEAVPSNSITCLKCYSKIPPEPPKKVENNSNNTSTGSKNRNLRLALAIIPGFFGVLGLGRIYQDPKMHRGYKFLIIGLLLFYLGNALLFLPSMGFFAAAVKTFTGVVLLFMYFILFLVSVLDSYLDFRMFVR